MDGFGTMFMQLVGCVFLSVYCLRVLALAGIAAYREILITMHKAAADVERIRMETEGL